MHPGVFACERDRAPRWIDDDDDILHLRSLSPTPPPPPLLFSTACPYPFAIESLIDIYFSKGAIFCFNSNFQHTHTKHTHMRTRASPESARAAGAVRRVRRVRRRSRLQRRAPSLTDAAACFCSTCEHACALQLVRLRLKLRLRARSAPFQSRDEDDACKKAKHRISTLLAICIVPASPARGSSITVEGLGCLSS